MMMTEGNAKKSQDIAGNRKRLAETIERLDHRNAVLPLQKLLAKLLPADLASILESFPLDVAERLFGHLTPHTAAAVLKELALPLQRHLVSATATEHMIPILELMAPDARTDIIANLEPELASRFMARLTRQSQQDVQTLMSYQQDTAGGLMTTQFFALPEETTVAQAIEAVRQLGSFEMVFYLYVVNEMGCLTGVSSLRQLLLAKPEKRLGEIMNSRVVKVRTDAREEEVAEIASHYRLLAIPVVDGEGVLVGMITVDDLIQVIREEATDDMLQAAGASAEEVDASTPWEIFKIRIPWLLVSFLGGLLACGVVLLFEEQQLPDTMMMMALLPMVLGMTGNFGAVAATVVVHALSTGATQGSLLLPLLFKELSAGIMLGGGYGVAAGGMTWLLFRDPLLSITVAAVLFLNMVLAGILAVVIPMLFHRFGADPARISRPIVAVTMDLLGVALYFLMGWVVQHYLPVHLMG